MRYAFILGNVLLASSLGAMTGCSSDDEAAVPINESPKPVQAEAPAIEKPDAGTVDIDDPGPPPKGCPDITKDKNGFFTRKSTKGSYVGFVPKSYAGKPTRLVVGLHGCGDSAMNFATWGVNPASKREIQEHIGISLDGASGNGNCWSTSDAEKVLAAVDDIATCFYVHKHEVVLAGFSSGGILAYGLGLKQADRFAGLLIENSALSSAGNAEQLLGGATWKINVAHLAHTQDNVFPIANVRADWTKIRSAGLPLETTEKSGGHDGTSADWADWLLPKMTSWRSP